jgi:hypothetical protein
MAAAANERRRSPTARLRTESQGARAARLRAIAPRYLAIAALLVLLGLGLRGLIWAPGTPHRPPPTTGADAPSEDFALQFARAYLDYDAERPGAHTRALAPFLSAGLQRDGGFFAESGVQRVLWAEVASDQAALLGGRAITVAAGVSTQRQPVYLAVTVRHPPGRPLTLVGYPSIVGAPSIDTGSVTAAGEVVSDAAVVEVAKRVIRNYLARSPANLKADLTGDAVITLPTVALSVRSVDQVAWVGSPGSGAVLVTVTAVDSRGVAYTLAYELGIAYRERPYVDFIEVIPTSS